MNLSLTALQSFIIMSHNMNDNTMPTPMWYGTIPTFTTSFLVSLHLIAYDRLTIHTQSFFIHCSRFPTYHTTMRHHDFCIMPTITLHNVYWSADCNRCHRQFDCGRSLAMGKQRERSQQKCLFGHTPTAER
jgi:hypothetical protein